MGQEQVKVTEKTSLPSSFDQTAGVFHSLAVGDGIVSNMDMLRGNIVFAESM